MWERAKNYFTSFKTSINLFRIHSITGWPTRFNSCNMVLRNAWQICTRLVMCEHLQHWSYVSWTKLKKNICIFIAFVAIACTYIHMWKCRSICTLCMQQSFDLKQISCSSPVRTRYTRNVALNKNHICIHTYAHNYCIHIRTHLDAENYAYSCLNAYLFILQSIFFVLSHAIA